MDGSDYFQCPYCGEIHPDDTVMCCKEMHVQKLSLPKCPECGSIDIYDYHHEADSLAPECNYKQCGKCNHQFDHQ